MNTVCQTVQRGAWPGVVLSLTCVCAVAAEVSAIDDAGHPVRLHAPARRIISLAPHATELLFAAGAGANVVGVSEYSNHPQQAAAIASVGGAAALDFERIVTLKPDLVVSWRSGTPPAQVARLRMLGIPVFESEPADFEAVATSLERLATLANTGDVGNLAAEQFRRRLATLRDAYSTRAPVTTFFQVWQGPLITLNDAHLASIALRVCGARNVFGGLRQLAPTVSIEAVVKANPDVIVASGNEQAGALNIWRRLPMLKAVAHGNLLVITGDSMTRPGPRIIEATQDLCEKIDGARRCAMLIRHERRLRTFSRSSRDRSLL